MVVRTGSEGRSTGTEVVTLEARPFEDAKRGLRGIYRVREFHMEGLPSWARKLLPQNALNIEEKTWDCYPYIKTGTLFLLLSSSSGAPLTLLPLANSDLAFSLLGRSSRLLPHGCPSSHRSVLLLLSFLLFPFSSSSSFASMVPSQCPLLGQRLSIIVCTRFIDDTGSSSRVGKRARLRRWIGSTLPRSR